MPSDNIEVNCANFATDDGLLFSGVDAGKGLVELLFTSCDVYSLSPTLSILPCTVANVTAKVKFELLLHNKKNFLLFSPDNSSEFTKFNFSGGSCALPPQIKVTGEIVFQDNLSGDFATELIKHLIQPAPQSLFFLNFENGVFLPVIRLLAGGGEFTVEGSMWFRLKNPNENKNWSGLI